MILASEGGGLYNIHVEWSTFIAQLFAFGVIIWLMAKYVAPPVRSMMAKQQDAIRDQLAASKEASARLVEAQQAHEKAIADAEQQAAQIREDARVDAQRISEQLRVQADAEVERIRQQGGDQLALQRAQLSRELKADLGAAALALASDRVREQLDSPSAKSDSVDRFLDELEAMAGGQK